MLLLTFIHPLIFIYRCLNICYECLLYFFPFLSFLASVCEYTCFHPLCLFPESVAMSVLKYLTCILHDYIFSSGGKSPFTKITVLVKYYDLIGPNIRFFPGNNQKKWGGIKFKNLWQEIFLNKLGSTMKEPKLFRRFFTYACSTSVIIW